MQQCDEAILPTDFLSGPAGEFTVIVAQELEAHLTSVPPGCTVTVLMDCDHVSTIVDVGGSGQSVSGLKQVWCGHTTKTELVKHSKSVWLDDTARSLHVKPRFHQLLSISNPQKSKTPTRHSMSRARPAAFCYVASQAGQTALEVSLPRLDPNGDQSGMMHGTVMEEEVIYGVLSYSFAKALMAVKYDATHERFCRALCSEIEEIRRILPSMDQTMMFTFTTPGADPRTMKILQPIVDGNDSSWRGRRGTRPSAVNSPASRSRISATDASFLSRIWSAILGPALCLVKKKEQRFADVADTSRMGFIFWMIRLGT